MLTTTTNQDFITAYLQLYESPQSVKVRNHRLAVFFKYFDNKAICTFTHDDFMKYFLHLKTMNYTRATGDNMWLIVKSFVEFVQESTNTLFNFPKKAAKWGNSSKHKQDTTLTIMDKAYIDMLLEKAKIIDYKKYIQLLLLKDTGMTISELLTIKQVQPGCKDDISISIDGDIAIKSSTLSLGIDIANRFVFTGVDTDARKHGRDITYPFSKETQRELSRYLDARRKIDSSNPYLFTSNGKCQHEQVRNVQNFIVQVRESKPITPHAFRRTINTLRKNMGCIPEDREFLINQKVSMNAEFYAKLTISEKLALYDKWNPYH